MINASRYKYFDFSWWSTLGLILFLIYTTGCTRYIAPPDNQITDPAQLRAAIDARIEYLESGRFLNVVLDYFGKGERIRVRQLILVKSPDKLRVQTRLPGSDEILSLLVSDGEVFSLHQRDTHEYYTGPSTRENINRLLPVDLSGPDVVRVMFGSAPWDRFDREGDTIDLRWDSRTGRYEYAVQTQSGGTLSMQVRPTDFAVVSVTEKSPDDQVIYQYTTDQWRSVNGIVLPAFRRFVWPAQNLDFSIDVGDTQLDVELDDMLFQFPPPPGSTIIDVDR